MSSWPELILLLTASSLLVYPRPGYVWCAAAGAISTGWAIWAVLLLVKA
jgi:hypothetical protein